MHFLPFYLLGQIAVRFPFFTRRMQGDQMSMISCDRLDFVNGGKAVLPQCGNAFVCARAWVRTAAHEVSSQGMATVCGEMAIEETASNS